MDNVALALTPNAHPIKIEKHDTLTHLHHTNNGVRQVMLYRETPHGLFVARPFDNHPRIRFWQAHLLPEQHLVVCKYDFHGHNEHDYYMDIAQIAKEGHLWTVRDLYLDLVLHDGLHAEIVDTDELLDSHQAGYITAGDVHRSVAVAHHTLSGLARARYSLSDWASTQGLELEWIVPSVSQEVQQVAHA